MSTSYREYLELFEYFGRGGAVRLGRVAFEALEDELGQLVDKGCPLSQTEIARVAELKRLLLRDRPSMSELRGWGR